VDQSSGVSVRLTVALIENVVSNAERRALHLGLERITARVSDLFAAKSAVTGKIELVFEGEREGPQRVAERILGQGVSAVFQRLFPAPYDTTRHRREPGEREPEDVYKPIVDWFAQGHAVVVEDETEDADGLLGVPTLVDLVRQHLSIDASEIPAACELVLEGLHQASLLAKDRSEDGVAYGDMLKRMFAGFDE
jgi:magnesium chelatase subunit I